jgi:hypothetical protein
MNHERFAPSFVGALAMTLVLSAQGQGPAEDRREYPSMAPIDRYLMADRDSEIALARSAAPQAISRDADIWVLRGDGYESVIKGKNGFTCLVERSWMSPSDSPDFWNPKLRGPVCYDPPATRSVLPITFLRTKLALARLSKPQMIAAIKEAVARRELPPLEPGAMSYMMSKEGYLGTSVGHWHPHLMFYIPTTGAATWGANLPGSPVVLDERKTVPEPVTTFFVVVGNWSDGTAAPLAHQ